MPEAARKDHIDDVQSPDGVGECCAFPSVQKTDEGSDSVFVNGIGIVRENDKMIVHNYPGPCCNPHQPVLDSFSSSVFINGKRAGRKGDTYGGDHVITTGSSNVFIGG